MPQTPEEAGGDQCAGAIELVNMPQNIKQVALTFLQLMVSFYRDELSYYKKVHS